MIYESRLELARLLFADFDVGVQRIALPFLLWLPVDGKERLHISRLSAAAHERRSCGRGCEAAQAVESKTVAFSFEWTRPVLIARGSVTGHRSQSVTAAAIGVSQLGGSEGVDCGTQVAR
ncbi:MAG: hypothetical protein WAW17_21020 [Rhodococcus sp. (in: high G+C Gram-positive bacteria)]